MGWVVDELKKCSILPEDTYVDSRLFAMRSADHVSELRHEKRNNVVPKQVRHKSSCTSTEDR